MQFFQHSDTAIWIKYIYIYIPLDKTIDICDCKLFGRKRKFNGFSKPEFEQLLQLVVKDSFVFNGKYYIQSDGVAFGTHPCQCLLMLLGRYLVEQMPRKVRT